MLNNYSIYLVASMTTKYRRGQSSVGVPGNETGSQGTEQNGNETADKAAWESDWLQAVTHRRRWVQQVGKHAHVAPGKDRPPFSGEIPDHGLNRPRANGAHKLPQLVVGGVVRVGKHLGRVKVKPQRGSRLAIGIHEMIGVFFLRFDCWPRLQSSSGQTT